MKKLFLFLISLTLTVGSFTACSLLDEGDTNTSSSVEESLGGTSDKESDSEVESNEEEKIVYSVVFKQDGQNDIVREVVKGEALTDVPTPTQKTGYTTVWSVTEFSSITENMTVTAVTTANEYTITYDAGEGTVDPTTQKVVYDSAPGTFATPTRENYDFVCWMYDGKAMQATDLWKIAEDVTFTASWTEKEKCSVTFIQGAYEPIVKEVYQGGSLATEEIPTPQDKVGYTVVWEEKDLTNITGNIIVNAIATPNTYKITYNAGEGATVTPATQDVVYDAAPQTFATPTREGYKFKGWEYNGEIVSASDTWNIASDVTLTAVWARVCKITLQANGGTVEQTTIEVVLGEAYSLPKATRTDHDFLGWLNGSTKIDMNGVWALDVAEITLKANWKEVGWTNNY